MENHERDRRQQPRPDTASPARGGGPACMIQSVFKFGAVGTFVFFLDFAALWLFRQFLPDRGAVSLAFFVTVSVHYCLNKFWTFGSRAKPPTTELARYGFTV